MLHFLSILFCTIIRLIYQCFTIKPQIEKKILLITHLDISFPFSPMIQAATPKPVRGKERSIFLTRIAYYQLIRNAKIIFLSLCITYHVNKAATPKLVRVKWSALT